MIAEPSAAPRTSAPRQFVRFLVVGVANTALSFVVYRLLLLVGTPYVVAAPIAFICGAVNGYVFNRRWTFDRAADSTRARILYFTFAVIGAAVTSGLVLLVVRMTDVGKGEAYLVAVPPVTVATFLANRYWTFADRR